MRRVTSLVATLVFTAVLWAVTAGSAHSQVVDSSGLDHLQCYRIKDSLENSRFTADLRNQFGLDQGCVVMTPARVLCVETAKQIVSDPQPPGGGPAGKPAGHFLCYPVRCPNPENALVRVQDQFGLRAIQLANEQLLCAPANKLICGDGEIDPGEDCDPGSDATDICPSGDLCSNACTCPRGDCCQCPNLCSEAGTQACPAGCERVPEAVCNDAGRCDQCPCGSTCTDPNGNAGHCRPTGSSAVSPCECVVDPTDCPCGTECLTAAGEVGACRPGARNLCICQVPPPPPDCQCGNECTTSAGVVGRCRPEPGTNQCTCQLPPPPPDCQCGKECTTTAGVEGRCRPDPTTDQCTCQASPPPEGCQCGEACVDENGNAGLCRPVPGQSGVCACVRTAASTKSRSFR